MVCQREVSYLLYSKTRFRTCRNSSTWSLVSISRRIIPSCPAECPEAERSLIQELYFSSTPRRQRVYKTNRRLRSFSPHTLAELLTFHDAP